MSWDEWFKRRRRSPFFDIFESPFRFASGDIDEFMREMERRMEESFKEFSGSVPRSLVRERKLPDGSIVREMGPFVYGYSVTLGPDRKPIVREFGNLKPSPIKPGLDVKETREPLVDTMSTNGEVKVVAEIPGVDKQDIKLHATENTLTISVDTAERKYYKELELPSEIDPQTARTTYKNGVLEVTLEKIKEKKPKGFSLKIE